MRKTYTITASVDASKSESTQSDVKLEGIDYTIIIVPKERRRLLTERMKKEGISLGPMDSARCPTCGR